MKAIFIYSIFISFFFSMLISVNYSYSKEHYADELFDRTHYKEHSTIIALNKMSTKKEFLKIKKGSFANFEDIKIILHTCWINQYTKTDHRALVEVLSDEDKILFSGWIFSNSPSLSNIEHPVYFIKLKSCD